MGHWTRDRPTPSSGQTIVSEHFLSNIHLPNDIELDALEVTHTSLLKAQERCGSDRG